MKFGVLGLGSIGLRHARNLRMLGHEVVGYDTDKKKQKEFQGKVWKREDLIPHSVAIYPAGHPQIDAYVIASPTTHHYQDLLDCMAEGKPTFVEKPIAATHEEWRQLQNFLSTKELMVGYMCRFHPCVKAAKNWIDQDYIGKPLWASFICGQFNDKPDYLRDGVVLNWSHEIDLALYLLGPAKVVAASVHAVDGKDDIADFVLQHDSGARSTIHLDYVTRNEIREAWIVGSEKNIGMDLLGRRNSMGKVIQEFQGDWNADYIDEMQAFVERCQGKETLGANGEDGLRVLEICQQVRKLAGLE